uniref:serine-rich adhesin for platelets isoform X1 n=1 Tax=Anopheles coluzzii TaxID=1518534 RepID=UPI0020FFE979|nr:serine-rich adhesin for platelets isoform X1 [Anopheles coluzzii]XP_049463917.1 serine-rich adhesin for platelets isoform X1 [Anopheles coluzzii]XP_049463918.1 serine-rich adhesin for platelets isoform X1 [Anopheles coluzzii]XP_049463919.1 serine-rich adhesin for platelets isoform X1 [Anopheles coluzzii]XP_049463920.1 serine-rich adhesin for platelets isoform X1 [Anopheles coluzzii]
MLELKLNRKASRMARLVALVALTGCLVLLASHPPSVQGRVIVRRQAEEPMTTVLPNDAQTAADDMQELTTVPPNDDNAANSKVATTPPRPNDRFEQFPADGMSSDSATLEQQSADGSAADEPASSLSDTAEQLSNDTDEEASVSGTTLAPSGEESMGSDAETLEDVGSASSASQSSSSQQQQLSDETDRSEDTTEVAETIVNTAAPAINEITTPAPTAAPARSVVAEGSEGESVSSSGASESAGSSEPRVPSVESDQSSVPEQQQSSEQSGQQQGTFEQDSLAEEINSQLRGDGDDNDDEVAVTTTVVPPLAPEVETISPASPANRSDDGSAPAAMVSDGAGERIELSRYTAPSNSSPNGTALLKENSAVEIDSSNDDEEDRLTTEAALPVTTLSALDVATDDASRASESVERNSSLSVERTQIETNTYEESSNEVERNQTLPARAKKGKFLDQFNEETTEDNDINLPNGAAWALAGMRMVERKQSDVGQVVSESTETVRDDSENVVGNNTLKQLMDWAIIMKEADFANSSFVRSTVSSDEPAGAKDRRTYANKVPAVENGADVLSEENRLTAIVTEAAPTKPAAEGESVAAETEDGNVVDTTFVPLTESPDRRGQELEDFKFEDRSTSSTTMANEVAGISESVNAMPTTTRRTYEVSENVDESEVSQGVRNTPEIRTTTTTTTSAAQRSDVSTAFGMFEDVPVTTYSPAAPILRRTEQTTPPIPLTTMITRLASTMPVRRPTTMQPDFAAITTTDLPVREYASTDMGGGVTFTTTVASSEAPIVHDTADSKPLDRQDSTESSEVNQNLLNRTDDKLMVATSTVASVTTVVPNLSSATLTNNVEFDDASAGESLIGQSSVTTERSDPPQMTTDESADDGGKVPIVLDDKHVYDTISTTVAAATTTASTSSPSSITTTESSSGSGQSVGVSAEAYTTRRTIDRSMTTTELSEEESVTEEDYIELNNVPATGGSGGASQGDGQNQTDLSGQQQGVAPKQGINGTTEQSQGEPAAEEDSSVVVAVVASIVSVIVVLLLIAAFMYYPPLQIVFRKRQNQVSYGQRCRPVGLDAYSLDNVSVYNSVRRKGNTARMSKRSYGNSAFEDPNFKTNPLTVAELANIIHNKTAIYDEFKEIPNVTARADEVPEGCEDKNRYANVVPLPETRVHLKRMNDDEKTEYINANFVKGPKDSANYYIACQAPMENTINDFWRMVWEQNSKVIIMATDLSENGVEKCAEYLPPSVVLDNSRTFGDFQLTLKNRENKEKYTISTVHMRHTPSNNLREIMHFWYQWPDTGVPIDESSIIGMLLEARTHLKLSPSELAEFATIAEESEEQPSEQPSAGNGTDNSSNNNNNNNNNNATSNGTPAGAGKEPTSIVSNGGTMDKHKSLQRTQGPLTVHCSPGTGRTGTLVACDIALRLLEVPPRTVDLPQIVYYVRRGRASAVRTREQYELIYRVSNVYATKLTGPTIET